jgi:hypothetical protein
MVNKAAYMQSFMLDASSARATIWKRWRARHPAFTGRDMHKTKGG